MRTSRARRLVGILLATALTLASCGGSDNETANDDTAEAPTAATEAGDDASTSGSTEQEETDTAHLVDHDMGETEVPALPQRVIVLDSPHLDTALSLGVEPIGAAAVFADQGLPSYLGDRTDGIEVVGTIEEPDLEAIAALNPDLILSATVRHEAIYEQLRQIAPAVFTESSGTDWTVGFELVAEALGKQDAVQEALESYRTRTGQLGDDLAAAELLVSIVRFLPGETRIYGPETFSGSVLADVGFQLPDLDYDEYSMAYISAEQVGLLDDADVIFTSTYGPVEETTRAEVTGLWANLGALQAGCQFDVVDDEWMIGIGLIGAEIILDDLERFLADGSC